MNKKLIKEVKDSFLNQFKKKPILVFSPGRINLIGEHTDYNEGFVFPAAINKGIIAGIQKSDSTFCKAIALNKSDSYEFKLNNLKSLKNGGWKNVPRHGNGPFRKIFGRFILRVSKEI